jgi:predicted porin
MKRSLIPLVLLGAFAGSASAQSSVTVYGRVDMGLGKPIGTKDKQVRDGGSSRLSFRGVEDLGGGLSAIFGFEHRFNPDTGTENAPGTFWQGYSTVGLRGAFGTVNLGRQYTPAFQLVQNPLDPWTGDTVAALRDAGIRPTVPAALGGGIGKTRIADSIRYDYSANGLNFAASIAEASQPGALAGPDRPISVAANYTMGPLFLAAAYEDPTDPQDKLWTVGARYQFGPAALTAGYSAGKTATDATARGYLLAVTTQIGSGQLRVGYATSKTAGITRAQKVGAGYHYQLSKRTKLYADLAHDSKATVSKTGYDFGLQHNF